MAELSKQTQEELFNLLYSLEEIFDYDKEPMGKQIGELINKLQVELLSDSLYDYSAE